MRCFSSILLFADVSVLFPPKCLYLSQNQIFGRDVLRDVVQQLKNIKSLLTPKHHKGNIKQTTSFETQTFHLAHYC